MSYPVKDMETTEASGSFNTPFDLKKFIYKLIAFIPWIILSVILGFGAAKLYLRYTHQMHKISAYVLIKDDEESSPDYNVLRELGVMPGSKEIQNQIDILQSYELSEGIVDSLNLQVKLNAEGRIASSTLYGPNAPVFIHVNKNDTGKYLPAAYQLFLYDNGFTLKQGDQKIRYNYNQPLMISGRRVWFERNPVIKADPNGYILLIQNKHDVTVDLRAKITVTQVH